MRRALSFVELATGAMAIVGGLLLVVRPDGSLLKAGPAALASSPFQNWRLPGILLAVLVGGGYLLSAWWLWRQHRFGCELAMLAGLGLIVFEAAELAWIGFQPLEALFGVVGALVITLAWSIRRRTTGQGRVSEQPR